MNDLNCIYSAKIAVVFILVLSLATLEAQRNEKDKFFDLITAIGEHLGGEFNADEKALKLDLNGANSFLEGLHRFATLEIVKKNENGQFECKESTEKPAFIKAIKTILGEDMINLLKVFPENFLKKAYALSTVLDEKLNPNKKVEDWLGLLKELSKNFSEEQLFNLLFSLGARLEALVHGKNIDGTLKEKKENPKDKIQTFLAVPKCFQESELSIFDYWIEIIKMKTKNSQKPIYGVAIFKEKYGLHKREYRKEKAFKLSRENYEILKQLNDQKFSIYESTKLLIEAFKWGYSLRRSIPGEKMPEIFEDLFNQINSVLCFNWKINEYWCKNYKCAYAMFFQNISENLMENKKINAELHLDSEDKEIQEYVQKDVEESCKKFDNEKEKIIFLNNVHYELAINFEYNQRKDIYDRAEHLLFNWIGDYWAIFRLNLLQLSEESYLKKNASKMLNKIKDFTSEKTNRESISIIEALIEKEHFNQFNLVTLFDQMKRLVKVSIPKEEAIFWKAIAEINTKQLENEIKFLKKNPKSIAEKKYQKSVQIICTIEQFGEKVKMLTPKIKNMEIKTKMIELSSRIENYKMEYFGPELLKQTKKFCKIEQIEMEEIVSEEIILNELQFEFDEIWNSSEGVWGGIEEYYLSIPLMQLIEQAQTLAKTFGKMLQNVKEHYAQ